MVFVIMFILNVSMSQKLVIFLNYQAITKITSDNAFSKMLA